MQSDPKPKTAVLGSGSWGTALSIVAAESGSDVILWGREPEIADAIQRTRRNPDYLEGIDIPDAVTATTEVSLVRDCDVILVVVPSAAVRSLCERLRDSGVNPGATFLSCAKGIERDTGLRMSEIVKSIFPAHDVAVLSGPNHAEEVAARRAAAAVIGCEREDVAVRLQERFALPWFRAYTNTDVIGIEWAGAVKNVFAIAAGAVDGLDLGDNAKAALVTRGLAEMVRIGIAHGGRPETFQGLSGVGDLVVTCYSAHSRNNRLGRMLGQGIPLQEAVASMKMVAEGVPNTESIYLAARRADVRTPIIDAVYDVLYNAKHPAAALKELLDREPRPEISEEDSPGG